MSDMNGFDWLDWQLIDAVTTQVPHCLISLEDAGIFGPGPSIESEEFVCFESSLREGFLGALT